LEKKIKGYCEILGQVFMRKCHPFAFYYSILTISAFDVQPSTFHNVTAFGVFIPSQDVYYNNVAAFGVLKSLGFHPFVGQHPTFKIHHFKMSRPWAGSFTSSKL